MTKIYEKIDCPICKSKKFKVLKKNINPNISLKEIKKFYLSSSNNEMIDQLVKCKKCYFVYLNPRVNSKIVLDSYKNNPDKEFVKHNKFRLKSFEYNFIRLKKYLEIKTINKYDILDVGTGGGTFLLAVKNLGFKVFGVEPNKWLVKYIKKKIKLNIMAGTLKDIKKKKYNLICFWDVFEHVTDLNETLLQCKKTLKKNGKILINIPNYGSLARKVLGYKWPFFLNVHLYYFDKKTLTRLLKKHGFKYERSLLHLQALPIKYVLSRAGFYFNFFNMINKFIPESFNFGIWYNVGQRIFLFKK
jgi:2-polyprenyl-3-methyl-5-hydroxy-6-metoxy-1,4-benzoquinol methylase|tara:strand:+ start:161 stop:1066 length:906 start_codon:yes stop_codon:yes gene_type:complete